MNINMGKKEFVHHITKCSLVERGLIIQEMISSSSGRMFEMSIPGSFRKEIGKITSRYLHKGRLSSKDIWKLWVFTMKPVDDLKNWRITGDQCYRVKPKGTPWAYQRSRPKQHATKPRRPTIRDVNGNAVPRRWIDRFCPHIKTQEDWDRNSIYRNQLVI